MKKISVFCLCIVLLLGFNIVDATNSSRKLEIYEVNKKYKELEEKVVMEINSDKVTNKQIDMIAAQLRTNNLKEIEDFLVERALIRQLAIKKGIDITRNNVIEYMENNRELLYSTQESKNYMKDFLENLNMTEEEYWTSDDTFIFICYSIYNKNNKCREGVSYEN